MVLCIRMQNCGAAIQLAYPKNKTAEVVQAKITLQSPESCIHERLESEHKTNSTCISLLPVLVVPQWNGGLCERQL